MKKLLFLFATAAIGVISANRASAQITGVNVYIVDSNLYNSCAIPYNAFYTISGQLTGTVPANDSVTININFGDGTDSIFKMPEYAYSGSTYFSTAVFHNFMVAGTYTPVITATSSNNLTANATAQTAVVTTNCASLSGTLYVDENGNCTYDAGTDIPLKYIPIMAINNPVNDTVYFWSYSDGSYSYNLPSGYTYTIIPSPSSAYYYIPSGLTASCFTSGSTVVTLNGNPVQQDFGFTCSPADSVDLYASAWAYNYRPGYNRTIEITAGTWWDDYECNNATGTVTLTLDPRLTYTSTLGGTTPTSVSGSTITWNWSSVTSLGDLFSSINVMCDASATLDDTICNTITITSTSLPDPNLSNNSYTFCAPISDSYDPNSKQVSPQGTGAQGYIANGTPLTYMINFQNTGSDTAYNVTVTDTLNANLDINSIKLDKASAPVAIATLPGNILNFRFNNINLPDSTTSATGSHGYVSYTVLPKSNLAPGTPITNQAHIYFDYNTAINTDVTLNTIAITTGIQHIASGSTKVSVFPNPASNQLYVRADDNTPIVVSMTDMLGRVVSYSENENGNAVINTQSLAEGMYLVKVTVNGKELTTKVNVQH
jgi:fimbrial isopeptide formation D2 family protein